MPAAPHGAGRTAFPTTTDLDVETETRSKLEAQFSQALTEHGAALSRLAASYTGSAGDRDDLVQDIALAFWLALPTFRGDCSDRTFLFRIAHNRGIRHLSRRRAHVSLDAEGMDFEDPSPGIEAVLSEEQKRAWLLGAVRSVPIIYREVLVLSLEGLDYAEIAQVLGISDSNVGVRLNRARQLLRKRLGEA